jgi:hypothetical protein
MSKPNNEVTKSPWSIVAILGLLFLGLATPAWAQKTGEGIVSIPDPNTPGEPGTRSSPAVAVSPGSPVHGKNIRTTGPGDNTQSEISMAASGPSIVISFNDFSGNGTGYVTSTDGGKTFSSKTSPPTPLSAVPAGDPGVTGDLAGRFYLTQIFDNDGAGRCTNSVHVSTDGGKTFSSIVGSPFSYASGTTDFPDMPHQGIDRVNLVGGQPQLYVFTRHFTSGINCPATGGSGNVQGEIVCSTDGGANWNAPFVFPVFTDNAHIATAPNGRIYVVGNSSGTMAGTTSTVLWRSTTTGCPAVALSFTGPTTVADNLTFGPVGIDREFPQPYVVVDQLNSDRVYVAWSSDRLTGVSDRDIFLARCDFAGSVGTCGAPVRINDNPIGDLTAQYFPMLCISPKNQILLSWNDRRSGSVQIFHTEVDGAGTSVAPSFLTSEVGFTPFDFPGTPDYGDYNENNQACDGNHLYVAWSSQVSPSGITPPSTDVDVFFTVVNNLQDVRVQGELDFGSVIVQGFQDREFEVLNVGDAPLIVNSVTCADGNCPDFSVRPNPRTPLIVSADAHVSFIVRFRPTTEGERTATIRVSTDDPDQPTIDLTANGTGNCCGPAAYQKP